MTSFTKDENNGCARAFWVFVHFFAVFCKTTSNDLIVCDLENANRNGCLVSSFRIERCHCMFSLSKLFWPISVLNRFTQLRHSKVKYKFMFLEGVVHSVSAAITKTPYRDVVVPFYRILIVDFLRIPSHWSGKKNVKDNAKINRYLVNKSSVSDIRFFCFSFFFFSHCQTNHFQPPVIY